MSSRDSMLTRIRRATVPATAHPGHFDAGIVFVDRERQFLDLLTAVGGQGHVAANASDAERMVRSLECFAAAKRVACNVPAMNLATFALEDVSDPHQLEDVDVAVLSGQFAVAENAAVWVSDFRVQHRALYFLAQHLVLVVPRQEIVDNLHQAYQRLEFTTPGYGLFISGPSKTADIEQSLVIGAHGPKSLDVILVGE